MSIHEGFDVDQVVIVEGSVSLSSCVSVCVTACLTRAFFILLTLTASHSNSIFHRILRTYHDCVIDGAVLYDLALFCAIFSLLSLNIHEPVAC